jgi:hypothetical protein
LKINEGAALRQGQAIMDSLVKFSPDNARWKHWLGTTINSGSDEIGNPRMWKES